MKNKVFMAVFLCLILCLAGCGTERENEHAETSESARVETSESSGHERENSASETEGESPVQENQNITEWFTEDTKISEVISDPAFGSYGRLIFPVDSWYYSGDTLGDLQLTWYNNMIFQEKRSFRSMYTMEAASPEPLRQFRNWNRMRKLWKTDSPSMNGMYPMPQEMWLTG